jgi:hypothetical protein
MKSLIQTLADFNASREAKDAAKQHWVTLMEQGDDKQHDARQLFLSADAAYAGQAEELGLVLTELRQIFCLEGAVESLPDEDRFAFYRLIAELRFDHLIAPSNPTNLEELATIWRRAGAMLTAARLMKQRFGLGGGDTIDTILGAAAEEREPDAWNQAAAVYRVFDAHNTTEGVEPEERVSDNLHASGRHLLKVYDRLTEQMQNVLQDLHDSGRLSDELDEMDPDVRRCIQNAIGGLVRQRQLQPEPKRETRPVATAEPEVETDPETDSGY